MYTYKYPHPAVTTDCVVFGFDGKELYILLIERGFEPFKRHWVLPGGFLEMHETAEQGAERELMEETNLKGVYLEQFHTFTTVDRDPRERVLTIAYYAIIHKNDYEILAGDDAAKAEWFAINDLPPLAFDHKEVIQLAKERIQEKIALKQMAKQGGLIVLENCNKADIEDLIKQQKHGI